VTTPATEKIVFSKNGKLDPDQRRSEKLGGIGTMKTRRKLPLMIAVGQVTLAALLMFIDDRQLGDELKQTGAIEIWDYVTPAHQISVMLNFPAYIMALPLALCKNQAIVRAGVLLAAGIFWYFAIVVVSRPISRRMRFCVIGLGAPFLCISVMALVKSNTSPEAAACVVWSATFIAVGLFRLGHRAA
jgi:hypothetical protein